MFDCECFSGVSFGLHTVIMSEEGNQHPCILVFHCISLNPSISEEMRPAPPHELFSSSVLSIAECCSTPYSLLGLVFTVSFIALGVLTLCKFYLQGYRAFMNDNTMHRSVSWCFCVRICVSWCVWHLYLVFCFNCLTAGG